MLIFKNQNEELESVIALDIDFNDIHDMLNRIRISEESTVYLVNSLGEKLDFVGRDLIASFDSDNLKDIFVEENNILKDKENISKKYRFFEKKL